MLITFLIKHSCFFATNFHSQDMKSSVKSRLGGANLDWTPRAASSTDRAKSAGPIAAPC